MKNEYVDKVNFLKCNILNPREYKPLENIYLGANVEIILHQSENLDKNEVHDFKVKCLAYYIELCSQIQKRFDNIDSYKIFQCLNPKNVLNGDLNITKLLIQYPNISQDKTEEISSEFREVSNLPTDVKKDLFNMDLESFWFKVFSFKNAANDKCFENVCSFVFQIISFPHSSAAAERIFHISITLKQKIVTD